ncbi:MAG: hypothetical protein ACRDPB_04180 [Nocardioidaceae bacterium]
MLLQPSPLPATGEVFLDARGGARSLRVSWHPDDDDDAGITGIVVLSLWRHGVCSGTFRLDVEDVPDLIDVLRTGLREAYARTR